MVDLESQVVGARGIRLDVVLPVLGEGVEKPLNFDLMALLGRNKEVVDGDAEEYSAGLVAKERGVGRALVVVILQQVLCEVQEGDAAREWVPVDALQDLAPWLRPAGAVASDTLVSAFLPARRDCGLLRARR